MTITKKQLLARRKHIGSSDSPAIAGADPWRSPHDVYLSKVRELEQDNGNAASIGNMVEPVLVKWAAHELGVKVNRNVMQVSEDFPIMAANLDAEIIGQRAAIEAKSGNIERHDLSYADEWGAEGTGEVPEKVFIQTQHQMFVCNLDVVFVPVLIGGIGRRMYRVERHDDVVALLVEMNRDFWTTHVQRNEPPTDSRPNLSVVKRIKRRSGPPVRIPIELVKRWQDVRDARLTLEKIEDDAQAHLLAALKDSDCANAGDYHVSYAEQSRVNKAREESTSTFRVLRVKKNAQSKT
jgi:putative phage-type endonuclease